MEIVFALYGAFFYGLSSSVSLCLASCLPVYLPILGGFGEGGIHGLKLSLGFAAGRFMGYFTLGITAAMLGAAFLDFFEDVFPRISTAMVGGFGILTVGYGIILLSGYKLKPQGHGSCSAGAKFARRIGSPITGSVALGFISTITPCIPVFTFLLLPFAMGKVWETSLLAIFFGLGANMVFVVIGVAVAMGAKNVKQRFMSAKRWIEIGSGLSLVLFGLLYVLWAIGPLAFGWGNESYILPSLYDLWNMTAHLVGI